MKHLPQLPYGAVYFRKSNPPREDWERDYAVAREDGMNLFRHWFMWGAIEMAPGEFDWSDYDRQMDLAAQQGMKTIIAEMITSVPEWAVHDYPEAVYMRADGSRLNSRMGVSSATGGFGDGSSGVLCLDCPDAQRLAGRFLTELVLRYKDHPAMAGYDVWNECNYSPHVCYCDHTKRKFREWLQEKYGSLRELGVAWNRYSYSSWEQVQPPAQLEPYPECLDWLEFKKDNFYRQMQWRIDLIRSLDSSGNLITAHGIAGSMNVMASMGADDWLAASKVEVYGFTWVASRKGSEPWKQWHAVDLTRAASGGKPFWHAEAQGGPLWLQPQVLGRPREDGRVTEPEDLRLWQLTSFAGGARGLLFPRWRPLLDGPLFGAFGAYGMDGSRTDRSRMASALARWANAPEQQELLEAAPVQGDIGILVTPEAQSFDYLLNREGRGEAYSHSMWGAYQGFFDNHIQADWVHIDQINRYRVLYWPYPIMTLRSHAEAIAKWVERGGVLISEGCPAYFGDRGRVGAQQPNLGLDAVFGAQESSVEFMPDILGDVRFCYNGLTVRGGVYVQAYAAGANGGQAQGEYADGRSGAAVMEHTYGKGRTLLVGTFPSEAYYRTHDAGNRAYFAEVARWAGIQPQACVSAAGDSSRLAVRLSEHPGGSLFLWVLNHGREEAVAEVTLSPAWGERQPGGVYWGDAQAVQASGDGNAAQVQVRVPGRDAVIVRLG
ncbi:beta-galactosidase [Paenibacillus cremeus]|uniref:beta-galactosidase n=1 Tax=Paenibacillus cremeus TaxID=2163881 RepID=A0A559KFX6_9BACL|nr:beta-galactosidase [Paenibacillus cremeus]TVY11033.1 beta-galactosidase [Paenibacillus cremeus]